MKKTTQSLALACCALATLVAAPSAFAQVALTATGTYTQNFSSMGTGTVLPTGWSVVSEAGGHYTFEPAGDYNGTGTATVAANENFTAGALSTSPIEYLVPTQGSSTGKGVDGVNYQNTLATVANGEGSESLGTDPSGNAGTIIELSLKNTSGSAISSVNLSYDIDRFTTISDTNGVPAGYPNSNVEEFPGYHLFYNLTPSNTATWVDVTAVDPTVNMGTTGTVTVPNTVGITAIPTTTVSFGGTVADNGTFALAWFDDNGQAPSPDQEIALNNVVISLASTPEPRSVDLGLLALGALIGVAVLRRRCA
jgi:hypothetical protein